jgi:transcriptional antiterminator NusG
MSDVIEETPADDKSAEETANEAAPAAVAAQQVATAGDTPVLDEDALIYEKVEDVDDEGEIIVAPKVISPYDRPGKWYVVHTQSGYEKKVKQNLEARTASMNMDGRIHEVVIPMEDVVEFRQGKKVVVQKKMFPGYLLVRCRLDDDSWFVIRNTPGVTGFVGQGSKPSPLPRREVETFLQVKTDDDATTAAGQKKTRTRKLYEMGETVRVKEGPFADFSGEVIELNEDQLKVKVLVNIFGRETPVELEFAQVAKL